MRVAVTVALALGVCAGCAPKLLWQAKDPRRQHVVRVEATRRSQFLSVDHRAGASFDGIALGGVQFSPNGSAIYYAATENRQWFVVSRDVATGVEKRSAAYDGIGQIVVSRDGSRVVFAAEKGKKWAVIEDGKSGPSFDDIRERSLLFSGDGSRLIYVGRRGKSVHAVVGGSVGAAYAGIAEVSMSADGRRVAYLARRGKRGFVVVDGVEGTSHHRLDSLRVSATGRVAYIASAGKKSAQAVVDGVAGDRFDRVERLTFSPDGTRCYYVGHLDGAQILVLDGVAQRPFEEIGAATFSPDGQRFAYAGRVASRWHRVVDGTERPGSATRFAFSPDGTRLAYATEHGVMLEGRAVGLGAGATSLVFSPDGKRFGFFLLQNNGERANVVIDKTMVPVAQVIEDTLVFSNDSRHWACMVADPDEKRIYVLIDGEHKVPVEMRELASLAIVDPIEWIMNPRIGEIHRDIVAAELEGHTEHR